MLKKVTEIWGSSSLVAKIFRILKIWKEDKYAMKPPGPSVNVMHTYISSPIRRIVEPEKIPKIHENRGTHVMYTPKTNSKSAIARLVSKRTNLSSCHGTRWMAA